MNDLVNRLADLSFDADLRIKFNNATALIRAKDRLISVDLFDYAAAAAFANRLFPTRTLREHLKALTRFAQAADITLVVSIRGRQLAAFNSRRQNYLLSRAGLPGVKIRLRNIVSTYLRRNKEK